MCAHEGGKVTKGVEFCGTLRGAEGERKNKSHLSSIFAYARRLFASSMKVCDSGLVHLYTLMRDIPLCISYTCIYMCNACVRVLLAWKKKEAPGDSKGLYGISLYLAQ